MPARRLNSRLEHLLHRAVDGRPFWDLCCDHGLLGAAAWHSGRFSEVIWNDVVPHVVKPLMDRWAGRDRARVLLSAAQDISEPLMGNVAIAGVGGEKIAQILRAHRERGTLAGCDRLLLCPEKDAEWLAQQVLPEFVCLERFVLPHNATTRHFLIYGPVAAVNVLAKAGSFVKNHAPRSS